MDRVRQKPDEMFTAYFTKPFGMAPGLPGGRRLGTARLHEVAARLVELTLGEPAGRVPDMGGPQVTSWADLLREYLRASHRRRWVVPVRIPGTRAVRDGGLLPPAGYAVGRRTWEQFLTTSLHRQATGATQTD